MSTNELHPSVQKFKDFVDRNPKVKGQLRKNHKLIQSYYEKYMILGEDDPFWDSLPSVKKESSKAKKDWIKHLAALMEDINWEEVSRQIDELNGAIGQFQQLITNVKKESGKKEMEYPYY
ncbi:Putative coat protein [Halobacillus dabanensis]|uniref:Putative coat protein n=1 Tax=Halobacillus dabanensis TaxID=240302 RepID=A0A1I3VEF7_HALDA|nr:spore coat protein YlbD [Halobacillus dabanensis]SFJ92541.1 Putative coat protein [Halobacillus dabanensis]